MDMKVTKAIASESGHWYAPDGSCAYTIIGKNGQERPTTLRDSRKAGLFPSVTTILRVLDKPGLGRWLQKQVLMSALTLPRLDGEGEDSYAERVIKDANEQSNKARDLGTEIHGAIERYMLGQPSDHLDICKAVEAALDAHFGHQEWSSEKSFAHAMGFGGKVDLHSQTVVADFKTKQFNAEKLPEIYDEHCLQIAAYAHGLGLPEAKGAIVFVSTSEPGLIHIVDIPEEELDSGWRMFMSALEIWCEQKRYWPRMKVGAPLD